MVLAAPAPSGGRKGGGAAEVGSCQGQGRGTAGMVSQACTPQVVHKDLSHTTLLYGYYPYSSHWLYPPGGTAPLWVPQGVVRLTQILAEGGPGTALVPSVQLAGVYLVGGLQSTCSFDRATTLLVSLAWGVLL